MEICTWHIRLFSWLFFISQWCSESPVIGGGWWQPQIGYTSSWLICTMTSPYDLFSSMKRKTDDARPPSSQGVAMGGIHTCRSQPSGVEERRLELSKWG